MYNKYVFISYVHEDTKKVQKIVHFFEQFETSVWFDKSSLLGGEDFKEKIFKAILKSDFFLPCFSNNFINKQTSYVYEELRIASEVLTSRKHDTSWFIPLRLEKVDITSQKISSEIYWQNLQFIDVFEKDGLDKLAETTLFYLSPPKYVKQLLKFLLRTHIREKINHCKRSGIFGKSVVSTGWEGMLKDDTYDYLFPYFFELLERTQRTQKHEYTRIVEPNKPGRQIVLSIVPNLNINNFLDNLPIIGFDSRNNYIQFIIEQRRKFRKKIGWEDQEFVHCIYFKQDHSSQFDMLYLPSFNAQRLSFEKQNALIKKSGIVRNLKYQLVYMEPTSITNPQEAEELIEKLYLEDFNFIS